MDALKPLTCSSTGLVSPSPLSSNLHLILTSSPIPLPPLSPAFDACQLSALAIKFSPLSRKIIPPQGSCVGSQLARSKKTMVEPYIWRQAGRVWSVTGPGEHSYPLSSPPHPFPHPLPSFPEYFCCGRTASRDFPCKCHTGGFNSPEDSPRRNKYRINFVRTLIN